MTLRLRTMKLSSLAILLLTVIIPSVHAQDYVLVTNAYNAKVSKIAVATSASIASIQVADSIGVPVPNIGNIVQDTIRNCAYGADHLANAISIINLNNWTTTGPIFIPGLGKQPIGMRLNKACNRLYVATRGPNGIEESSNPLEVIAITGEIFPPSLTHLTSVPVGKHPINVVLSHDDHFAVVTCRNQACFTVVNTMTDSVAFTFNFPNPTYEPEGIDIHPALNLAYIFTHGQNTIVLFDLDSMKVTKSVPISGAPPPQPSGGKFAPSGNLMLVSGQVANKVFVFDTQDPYNPVQMPYAIPVGPQPHQPLFVSDTIAYVPNTNNTQPIGSISILETGSTPANIGQVAGVFQGPLSMTLVRDRDNDGIPNGIDNCPFVFNPTQQDTNGNGIGDACESTAACTPGDANGDGMMNVSDAVALISYIFSSGPAPTPYPICSGDANCDCSTNVSDVVLLIGYIFGGSSTPCTGDEWSTICGVPYQ